MKVEFEEDPYIIRVWIGNGCWLGIHKYFTSELRVFWYEDRGLPKVKDYLTDINNPTSEEVTMFALEFGDKLADMLFHNEKKVVFMIY